MDKRSSDLIKSLDTITELAESPLKIETRMKSGMGLDKGLSPTYDLLVDKYFEISDGLDQSITRLSQNEIARHVIFAWQRHHTVIKMFDIRFDDLVQLEQEQRESFVNEYGELSSHIVHERFRSFPIVFGFQKNSIFTSKFSEMIR